jgi:hypothetical protein
MKAMKWYIITSQAGTKILPIQKHLFYKYIPEIRPNIIDLDDNPIDKWCAKVADLIDASNPSNSIVLFLDDHLLLDRVVRSVSMPKELERLELGKRTSNHKTCIDANRTFLSYSNSTPYKVSCQPSIWRTEALIRELRRVNGSPWDFESKGVCTAGIIKEPIVKIADESALSKRWQGVNLRGMKKEDIEYIIKKGWITEDDIRRDNF